jgi:hypothetical protein
MHAKVAWKLRYKQEVHFSNIINDSQPYLYDPKDFLDHCMARTTISIMPQMELLKKC